MTELTDIIEEVTQELRLQPMAASEYSDDDFEFFVKSAIRDLYVTTGRALQFSTDGYTLSRGRLYWRDTLNADEIEYIVLVAKRKILDAIRKSVSEQVSYTTDALSVTGGDKPYKNLTGEIAALDQQIRIVYHKMVRFTLSDIGADL